MRRVVVGKRRRDLIGNFPSQEGRGKRRKRELCLGGGWLWVGVGGVIRLRMLD